jgi:hypothetical protein
MKALTPEKFFYVQDGKVLTSLDDLTNQLPDISEDAFTQHVNKDKNDFSNWIGDAIGDTELAKQVKKVKTKSGLLKKLKGVETEA